MASSVPLVDSIGPSTLRLVRRAKASIDHLVMQPLDVNTLTSSFRAAHVSMLCFFVPAAALQEKLHKRYEVEVIAEDPNGTSYGVATLVTSLIHPLTPRRSLLERIWDPPPFGSVSFNIMSVDRTHWQRSSWCQATYINSLSFGRLPRSLFGLNNHLHTVSVDAQFDEKTQTYTRYNVQVEGQRLRFGLQDTGLGLLDPRTPVVPGFLDNESALRALGMRSEVVMRGHGGLLYRQPMWSSLVHPNRAVLAEGQAFVKVVSEWAKSSDPTDGEAGAVPLSKPAPPQVAKDAASDDAGALSRYGLIGEVFNCPPPTAPFAAWLVDEVPCVNLQQIEAHIEDENDPASGTHNAGEKGLQDRIQRRAMNRYVSFRDEVRSKAYSDIEGTELPR